ncbi:hypothetical protein EW145_g3328 [Phellinidium pouzarii]|uniref:Uncharacterized protein n=1 Tax=Phellinidium pouzarii TaxID=167371 RepID=A0A4S4L7H5_9AGAM|nr:hypothetical protein EW145_g3328 [Phellinidium pouzarii]
MPQWIILCVSATAELHFPLSFKCTHDLWSSVSRHNQFLHGRLYDLPSTLDGEFESEIDFHAISWSETRVRERTETDFCTSDAYWLMSYRTILIIYEYANLD